MTVLSDPETRQDEHAYSVFNEANRFRRWFNRHYGRWHWHAVRGKAVGHRHFHFIPTHGLAKPRDKSP